jgi:Flp pilus assembly protein TadG
MMTSRRTSRERERGQVLVLFALSLIAIIAMVGLVLDGGSAFAQRRSEQNAADLAALAGANNYLLNHDTTLAVAAAKSVAAENGYTDGSGGVSVTVGIDLSAGARVTVDIGAPHQNNFAGIVGMPTWAVGTTATALTGFPDTATGPGPFILSRDNFGVDGAPLDCTDPNNPCSFTHPIDPGTAAPQTASDFVWTNFGLAQTCAGPGNVDNQDLTSYLADQASFTLTLQFGCYIGQHNQGVMNDVVSTLESMAPVSFPIPVVDHNGNFTGWVTFELTSATPNGRNGVLSGYFASPFKANQLTVTSPGLGNTNFAGSYVLKLVN